MRKESERATNSKCLVTQHAERQKKHGKRRKGEREREENRGVGRETKRKCGGGAGEDRQKEMAGRKETAARTDLTECAH